MKRLTAPTGLLITVLASVFALGRVAIAQEASVYKWVDPQGVPHYSDQPPVNISSEELPIRYRRTDRSVAQNRAKSKAGVTDSAEPRDSQQADAGSTGEADNEKVLAEREATCKQAKDRVAKYENAQRLYKPGPNGERIYLTDEELDVERADAKRAVDEWCGDE